MKLHNAGVLWLSGSMFGWASSDVLATMRIYNPSSWSIVAVELVLCIATGLVAFHPMSSGNSSAKSL